MYLEISDHMCFEKTQYSDERGRNCVMQADGVSNNMKIFG